MPQFVPSAFPSAPAWASSPAFDASPTWASDPSPDVTVTRGAQSGTSTWRAGYWLTQRAFGTTGPAGARSGSAFSNGDVDGDTTAIAQAQALLGKMDIAMQALYFYGTGSTWLNPTAGVPDPTAAWKSGVWHTMDVRAEQIVNSGSQLWINAFGCPQWLQSTAPQATGSTTLESSWSTGIYDQPPFNGTVTPKNSSGTVVPITGTSLTNGLQLWALMVQQMVWRYTHRWGKAIYVPIWSETRNLGSLGGGATTGITRATNYTALYNAAYDALKDPSVFAGLPLPLVGGPFYTVNKPGGGPGAWTTMAGGDTNVVGFWMQNCHGADFVCCDGCELWSTFSVAPKSSPDQVLALSDSREQQTKNILALMQTSGTFTLGGVSTAAANTTVGQPASGKTFAQYFGSLPFYWLAAHFDANQVGNSLDYTAAVGRNYTDHRFQACAQGSMCLHDIKGGASGTVLWQGESVGEHAFQNTEYSGIGNQECLVTTCTATAGSPDVSYVGRFADYGGQPLPLYWLLRDLQTHFGAGQALYEVTSTNSLVEVIDNGAVTLALNKDVAPHVVPVPSGAVLNLPPYAWGVG